LYIKTPGGIEGRVFGSLAFTEGQRFETSPIIKGELDNGSVVTTQSGSRYFLSGRTVQQMKEGAKSTPLPKELRVAAPSATIQLTRQARDREAKAAMEAVSQAKPGSTISLSSLFGFGGDDDAAPSKGAATSREAKPVNTAKAPLKEGNSSAFSFSSFFDTKSKNRASPALTSTTKANATSKSSGIPLNSAPIKNEAPKGVPTIERWKADGDKAITGFIRGAIQFRDGEKITTSPIAKGSISSGELVVTSSGTRYFLK
jgi:hypothetical protein